MCEVESLSLDAGGVGLAPQKQARDSACELENGVQTVLHIIIIAVFKQSFCPSYFLNGLNMDAIGLGDSEKALDLAHIRFQLMFVHLDPPPRPLSRANITQSS